MNRSGGFRLGQGLGSSRTRWFPWSTLFLKPHIPFSSKSNPVSPYDDGPCKEGYTPSHRARKVAQASEGVNGQERLEGKATPLL